MWCSCCTIKSIQNCLLVIDLLSNICLCSEEYFLFHMIRNCFYDGNDDVKNNNGFEDHADNPDNECHIYFIELLRVS